MRKLTFLTLILAVLLVPNLTFAHQEDATIADVLQENEDFSTLVEVLEQAELLETLAGEGPFTVFAPTNEAIEALPEGMLEGIMSSPESLVGVLQYHVVEGAYLAADLEGETSLDTVLGSPLAITVEDGTVLLNGDVTVTEADIEASNGVIHVIDTVLVPGRPGADGAPEAEEEDNTLAGVLAQNEDLSFLASTLESLAPELVALLQADAEEGLPMFLAPSNDAFLTLDAETRQAAADDRGLFGSILLYHIVPQGMPLSDQEVAAMSQMGQPIELPTALPGTTVTLTFDEEGTPLFNEIPVTERGIMADNGVLHVIGGLLLPPEDAILSAEDFAALIAELAPVEEAEETEEGDSAFPEGPALQQNWAIVGDGFGMEELDSADDFFVTVNDPFTGDELYGVQIINWTAEYEHTGFIVENSLPADVLIWMAEQDPTTWENISPVTVSLLPAEELAKLPEEVQALAAE
jgi:transforming growth factor-beta-induced protein